MNSSCFTCEKLSIRSRYGKNSYQQYLASYLKPKRYIFHNSSQLYKSEPLMINAVIQTFG